MMDWIFFTWQWIIFPLAILVGILELLLTKRRAGRYQAALELIANDPFATDYDKVRAQRDRCMDIARRALLTEPNAPRT